MAIGINGVTECPATSRMPSTDIAANNAVVLLKEALFSFGGKLAGPDKLSSDANYKYTMKTDSWTQLASLIQERYIATASVLSSNEIFITGTPGLLLGIGLASRYKFIKSKHNFEEPQKHLRNFMWS